MTAPTLVEHVALGADFNRRVAAEGNMAERTVKDIILTPEQQEAVNARLLHQLRGISDTVHARTIMLVVAGVEREAAE